MSGSPEQFFVTAIAEKVSALKIGVCASVRGAAREKMED
jgi:hypothetical protein